MGRHPAHWKLKPRTQEAEAKRQRAVMETKREHPGVTLPKISFMDVPWFDPTPSKPIEPEGGRRGRRSSR